jgi:hypothetical protein
MKKFSRNIVVGCAHNCVYCYARATALENNVIHSPEEWTRERIVPEKLNEEQSLTPGVLYRFPTHHDITPALLQPSLIYIDKLLRAGNAVEVCSKPHLECIRAICETFQAFTDKLRFCFTIGSTNAATCAWLEPGAPTPEERIEALKLASRCGFKTSVSIEPMLEDEVGTSEVIRRVYPYVTEEISIGRMWSLSKRISLLGRDREEVLRYFQFVNADKIIRAVHERFSWDRKIQWEKTITDLVEFKPIIIGVTKKETAQTGQRIAVGVQARDVVAEPVKRVEEDIRAVPTEAGEKIFRHVVAPDGRERMKWVS